MSELQQLRYLKSTMLDLANCTKELKKEKAWMEEKKNSFAPRLTSQEPVVSLLWGIKTPFLWCLAYLGLYGLIFLIAWVWDEIGIARLVGHFSVTWENRLNVIFKIRDGILFPSKWIGYQVLTRFVPDGLLPFELQQTPMDNLSPLQTLICVAAAILLILLVFGALHTIRLFFRNRKNRKKNEEIKLDNDASKALMDIALEDWLQSEEFQFHKNRISSYETRIARCQQAIQYNNVLHDKYKNYETVTELIEYLETGRASTLKEAINLMHTVRHHAYMEYLAEQNYEEAQQARIASEKAAAYQRQAAEDAAYARKEADRASNLAAANLGATLGMAREIDKMQKR